MKEGFVWRMGLTKKRRKHRRLLAETGGCCIYCGRPISEYNATLDHIIPMSRGDIMRMRILWLVARNVIS